MRVRTAPGLWETTAVQTPALRGLLRPRLLLPPGLAATFTREELRHVFLHELAHLRRRDAAANWAITLLRIAHWFNPLVWWGFNRMRADRELACDTLALSIAGTTENRAYGQIIIKLLERSTTPALLPGLAGILEDRNEVKRRLRMIARHQPTQRWALVSVLLAGGLGLIGLTGARTSPARAAGPPQDSHSLLWSVSSQEAAVYASQGHQLSNGNYIIVDNSPEPARPAQGNREGKPAPIVTSDASPTARGLACPAQPSKRPAGYAMQCAACHVPRTSANQGPEGQAMVQSSACLGFLEPIGLASQAWAKEHGGVLPRDLLRSFCSVFL